MAKAKKKLLPKDFDAQLKEGDLAALKAVFDICDVNARGGYAKQTALAFHDCPDELATWLVEQGADPQAEDHYGATPLHTRAGHRRGRIEGLLKLGVDVNHGENAGGTPLHRAAGSGNAAATRLLLRHGARVHALDQEGSTPLAHALRYCSNARIADVAAVAEVLVEAGGFEEPRPPAFLARLLGRGGTEPAGPSPQLKAYVTRIGTEFEFHRSNFDPDLLAETSAGLDRLYTLFGVAPIPRRSMHDGRSPIVARARRMEDRFEELWAMLVPSNGAADTVQGEVIRIAGKIGDELLRNGGGNWDADYRRMADDFLIHIGSGMPIPAPELAEARRNMVDVKNRDGDTTLLCELAVQWVALNPEPVKLPPPAYTR